MNKASPQTTFPITNPSLPIIWHASCPERFPSNHPIEQSLKLSELFGKRRPTQLRLLTESSVSPLATSSIHAVIAVMCLIRLARFAPPSPVKTHIHIQYSTYIICVHKVGGGAGLPGVLVLVIRALLFRVCTSGGCFVGLLTGASLRPHNQILHVYVRTYLRTYVRTYVCL